MCACLAGMLLICVAHALAHASEPLPDEAEESGPASQPDLAGDNAPWTRSVFAHTTLGLGSVLDRLGLAAAHGHLMALETRGRWLFADADGGLALRHRRSRNSTLVYGTPVKFKEGGVWAVWQLRPVEAVRVTFGVLAGLGQVSWFDQARSDAASSYGMVVAPEASIEIDLGEHLRLGVALGFRTMTHDDGAAPIGDDPLRGFTGTVLLDIVDF